MAAAEPVAHEELQRALSPTYTVERELNGGGMSRVFLATENALGRRVVIKVLGAGVSSSRFAREVRLTAAMQQANIVPVLAAGDAGGVPYYTMPFVEGLSLRERLAGAGKPAFAEAVAILRDVARALAYAHDRGVVHRDIKPENVLLSGGAAVVTDFGIAKALADARTTSAEGGTGASTVTEAGTVVGTPAYMAPEQIAGDPAVDRRADLYAFGCLAYEILAGDPPFAHRTGHAALGAHLAERPVPLSERCPECPPAVARLVARCLEKDPAARPQSAAEVLAMLEGSTASATPLQQFWHRRTRFQRGAALALITVTLAAGIGATWYAARDTSGSGPVVAIAVVPFVNLSGDSTNEYLSDGIADELATSLGKVPGIRITSRSLSYRYKGRRDLNARELGRALDAEYVLHGSVRPALGRLRVSAQVTNASDNTEAWSESYDRAATDAFVLQTEIARSIVSALSQRLGVRTQAVARAGELERRASPEAYNDYLHGRFLLRRRGASVRDAVERFARATDRDNGFAPALAAHALALELLPYFEPVDAREMGRRAIPLAQRALSLDSSLAEAHTALAMAYQHLYRWSDSETEYRQALAKGPNDLEAHIQYGRFLFYMGRIAESGVMFERARAIDPYSAVASGWYGHVLFAGGRQTEGLRELRRALEFEPANPPALVFMAGAYRQMGRQDSARAYVARLRRDVPAWNVVGAALLAELGEHGPLLDAIRVLESQRGMNPQANVRLIGLYAALRDSSRTMDAMERATANGEPWPTWRTLSDPGFDFLRRSARFDRIVRNVGLDARIFTSPTGGRSR